MSLPFYEQLSRFDTARLLIRLGTVLRARGEPSHPSVFLGFRYFDSAYRAPDGRLRLPAKDEPFRGRHYVGAVDSDDPDVLAFANSWGERWGRKSLGVITREYFEAHVDAVLARWSAVAGPSPDMFECLNRPETRRLPQRDHWPHCWPTRNSKFWAEEIWYRDMRHQLLTWDVFSMATGGAVRVYEVRNPLRIIGRVHLFFERDDTATLRELFVLPNFRRRGYGSLLEEIATDEAVRCSLRRVHIWLHEGDARPRVRPAAEQFATSRGYVWANVTMTRPNVVAIATKELT